MSTVAEVLAKGEWVEKKDAASGKVYYYHKATKKTTWNLAKELGLAPLPVSAPRGPDAPSPPPRAATPSSVAATPPPAPDAAATPGALIPAALASGEWVEKKDKSSGKTYYYNRTTKKTTWNLEDVVANATTAADGCLSTEMTTATVAGAAPDAAAAAQLAKLSLAEQLRATWAAGVPSYDAVTALSPRPDGTGKAEWREVHDRLGRPFYINDRTGESTGDLDLYLRIRRELDTGAGAASRTAVAAAGSQLARITAALGCRDSSATAADAERRVREDWVSVLAHTSDADRAAKRLLADATRADIVAAADEVEAAHREAAGLRNLLAVREKEITALRAQLSLQHGEIERLQNALFYGVGGHQADGGLSSASTTSQIAAAITAGTAGRLSGEGLGLMSHGRGGAAATITALRMPPPPTMNAFVARAPEAEGNVARRIATLERLVFDLQAKNRQLVAEADAQRAQQRHLSAGCPQCQEGDPWQRLLAVARR